MKKSARKEQFIYGPVTRADFNDWLAMGFKLWPYARKNDLSKTFTKILKSQRETAFICRANGKSIAFQNTSLRRDYVAGAHSSPVGYLEGIFVEKNYRGRGIARKLVEEAEKWAAGKGCTEIGSDSELKNIGSRKFHKAIGFKEVERIVAYIKKIDTSFLYHRRPKYKR